MSGFLNVSLKSLRTYSAEKAGYSRECLAPGAIGDSEAVIADGMSNSMIQSVIRR